MRNCKADHDFDILLSNVQLILRSKHGKRETINASSELNPSNQCCNSIGYSFTPSSAFKGIALKSSISSGEGYW
jgi:hypothetical protein